MDIRPTLTTNVSAPATAPVASGTGQSTGAGAAAALREVAKAVAEKKKRPAKRRGGISQARKRYTDVRKTKLANLRSIRDKRIREFNAKTKKLPPKERNRLRKEFKAKQNGIYKEQVKKFPTARGMNDPRTVLGLIKKLEGARM